MERHGIGRDVDMLRRRGKGGGGAAGNAGKREEKFAKVHICQCAFAPPAGLASNSTSHGAGHWRSACAIKSRRVSPGRRNDYVAPTAGRSSFESAVGTDFPGSNRGGICFTVATARPRSPVRAP